ncbi:hypothetical protein D3C75_1213540 [compost metagenome]
MSWAKVQSVRRRDNGSNPPRQGHSMMTGKKGSYEQHACDTAVGKKLRRGFAQFIGQGGVQMDCLAVPLRGDSVGRGYPAPV